MSHEAYKKKYNKYKTKYNKLKRTNILNQGYDYIIVGGGSAGCVVASRLSENNNINVLVIEAGKNFAIDKFPKELIDAEIIGTDKYDWGFKTTKGIISHKLDAPAAKTIGGSSAHNAGVLVRAKPSDFKRWESLGVSTWNYPRMLEYYKKFEHSNVKTSWHGFEGPVPAFQENLSAYPEASKIFVDTCLVAGIKFVNDFNGDPKTSVGVGITAKNIQNKMRINDAISYLNNDVRSRKNLTILDQTTVNIILFDNKTAMGVILQDSTIIKAKHEVILCAGTYGSCMILLRSGIGPKEHLDEINVKQVIELPVDKQIIDHPFYTMSFIIKNLEGDYKIGNLLWLQSSKVKEDEFDLHVVVTPDKDDKYNYLTFGIGLTLPKSVGSVKLSNNYINSKPIIDLNLLSNNEDVERIIEAVRIIRKLVTKGPLADYIVHENSPGNKLQSDDELARHIKDNVEAFAHPCCTNPMSKQGEQTQMCGINGVVDESGKVHGIKNLRVVDASIFPYTVSCPLHATVLALAEGICDMIKKERN